MAYQTFEALKQQVEVELDIEAEEFIQPSEIIGYFNRAIRIVEAEIVKIGLKEKYLQAEAFLDIVAGQQDYDLPSDIIATKIRKVVYKDSVTIYTLSPYKTEDAYEGEDVLNFYSATNYYQYMLYKNGEDYKFRLVPKSSQTLTDAIRIIYFKELNRYVTGAENCDVPDVCYEFILSVVRYHCYLKEGNTRSMEEKQNMDNYLQLMRETLQNQIADPDNDLVDLDVSHYEEMN